MRLGVILVFLSLAGAIPGNGNDFSRAAVGTKSSEFLLLDLGARGIAMGGAYTAVTSDADSLYWNPAGLAHVPRFSASAMYARYLGEINYQTISAAHRITDSSVIAGGLRTRDLGTISQTDLAGNTVGAFHPRDTIAEFGWGQSLPELSDNDMELNMGLAARYIHSDYVLKADGYSADLGLQGRMRNSVYPFDVALAAQNMGQGQKFDQQRDPLPLRFRLGAAVYPTTSLILSGDFILPSNNVMHGAVGAEYSMEIDRRIKAALRAGINTLTAQTLGTFSTLSMGFGIKAGNLNFDYAFAPGGILGLGTHRFSVGYNLPISSSQRYRER